MKRDSMLVLRLPEQVKQALKKAADAELRTMSSMATWVLAQWLTERGHLEKKAPASPTRRRRKEK